jgi:putative tricarboxylic transport membrane protein
MDAILASMAAAATPWQLAFILLGTVLGVIVGAIPGLSALMLITLSLPLTFYMSDGNALAMLVGMYVGGIAGGAITAILLGIPGTPSSIITLFDGHALAKRGEPERALGWAIFSSFIGSVVSWVALASLAVPLSHLALRLGPFDLFSLCALALITIVSISRGDVLLGIGAGLAGALVSFVGADPIGGDYRLTFGFNDLAAGFDNLPVLVGLFAGAQVIEWAVDAAPVQNVGTRFAGRVRLRLGEIAANTIELLRSSLIGTLVGILPGIGGNIGSILAYSAAKASSKRPQDFGKGAVAGIIASEAGNNATVGGALVPMISLGIPGSVIDVVLMGAMTIHGIQPGPYLFRNNPDAAYTMISSLLLASFAMLGIMWLGARYFIVFTRINRNLLFPLIAVFCVLGSFALANRWFDVGVMFAFSLLGFVFGRGGFPTGPFVIGLVLGPMAEKYYRVGLMESGGTHLPLLTSPVSAISLIAMGVLLAWPVLRDRLARRQASAPGDLRERADA